MAGESRDCTRGLGPFFAIAINMHVYLLVCDVTKSEDRYQALSRLIESKFDHQRLGRFAWAIETDVPAAELCELISPHITASDRMFVVRASRDIVWSGFPPKTAAWLRKHVLKGESTDR